MSKQLENYIEKKEREELFGKNIEIQAYFLRHSAKNEESGALTEKGVEASKKFGEEFDYGLEDKQYILKAYSSEIGRAKDTADTIIENVNTNQKGHTRISLELGKLQEEDVRFPNEVLNLPYSEYIKVNRQEIKGKKDSLSFHSIAQRIAKQIEHFIKLSKRLKNNSIVDLINISHLPWISAFIKEVIGSEIEKETDPEKKQKLENKITNLNYLDGFIITIKRDNENVALVMKINDQEFILTEEIIKTILKD